MSIVKEKDSGPVKVVHNHILPLDEHDKIILGVMRKVAPWPYEETPEDEYDDFSS